ncbi:TolC family protein [Lentisphaera profundi]|uniref:TolC family protein n=1 Tax=Lentisphaera profundi TaxID=1658616 RepID=A0ABY7W1V3_9BACT|nr:TolC family protein [Lentisphaera profundi]WDE99087.1 TolC family protein [Lentisphaera profundi]
MRKYFYSIFFALALSSCSSWDALDKEEMDDAPVDENVQARWLGEGKEKTEIGEDWWHAFGDPELDRLIKKAAIDSFDLTLARNRVLLAQKELSLAQSEGQISGELNLSQDFNRVNRDSGTNKEAIAGGSLSWQADIWGRISSLSAGALAEYQATQADYDAVVLQMVYQVAVAYFSLREYDELITLHNDALMISDKLYLYYKVRYESGLESDELFLAQEAENLRLKANVKDLERLRHLQQNTLATLMGEIPGSFKLKPKNLSTAVSFVKQPDVLNANLLERRPDLVAAELRIKSAWNYKEAARAAHLPDVSVTLTGATDSSSISGLFSDWVVGIMPSINFPILDPTLDSQEAIARVKLKNAEDVYRKTVSTAIGEVQNAIINLQKYEERRLLELQRLERLLKAQEKSQVRLENGLITQLELLQYQREVLASREDVLNLKMLLLSETITLYNALGGPWKISQNQED